MRIKKKNNKGGNWAGEFAQWLRAPSAPMDRRIAVF